LKNKLWGVLLILIGVVLCLNALDITNIDLFFEGWWTLFIIVPCFTQLFTEKVKIDNMIGLLIGLFLLLSCQGIVDFNLIFKLGLPVILVIIGISIVFKDSKNANKIIKNKKALDYCSTFSGQTIRFENEEFDGCNLNAIFGGIKCDLTNVKVKDTVLINASAIFGGINIVVPREVKVEIKNNSIFGGVSNKHNNKDGKQTIYIEANCLFGGIVIHDTDSKDN